MGLFNGLSHAVVFFNKLENAKATGIYGMMKICFGSDDNAIAQILYSIPAGGKTPVWTLPTRHSGYAAFPIFTGSVGEEILGVVGRTADRLKKANIEGKLAERAFRVTKTTVEEIKQETKSEASPSK
jgi:hypothetical protein